MSNIDISLYGKYRVSDEDDALLVERGFHCLGVIEVPVELTMSASGAIRVVAKSLDDNVTEMITVAGSDKVLIRSVTVERQELQCDLCEWRWLVPEHEGVRAVAIVAQLHWVCAHGPTDPVI